MNPSQDWSRAAEDLGTLSWLHASERNVAVWRAMLDAGFPQGLVLLPADDPAMTDMRRALEALSASAEAGDPRLDDALAVDYAAIYLTHAHRASPCESVWLDEDHLMWQGPTFAVRAFYSRHGMGVNDWREMPDDHLAHELAFVGALLARGELGAAHDFLTRHLLVWLPAFAARVAQRADTQVYAALAVLTAQACLALKESLEQATATVSVGD